MLEAELDEHLGYDKHQSSSHSNSRNGYSNKRLSTDDGNLDIKVPRDRDSSFEPKLVKKQQTCFTGKDDKILFLYAQGMSTREICTMFKELYDVDVSPTLIYRMTNAVMEKVIEWQSRPLDQFDENWAKKYSQISQSWRQNWDNLNTLFTYPPEIRKAIYTTNAIESLDSMIRKTIKKRKLFPHDDAAKKVIYLATRKHQKMDDTNTQLAFSTEPLYYCL